MQITDSDVKAVFSQNAQNFVQLHGGEIYNVTNFTHFEIRWRVNVNPKMAALLSQEERAAIEYFSKIAQAETVYPMPSDSNRIETIQSLLSQPYIVKGERGNGIDTMPELYLYNPREDSFDWYSAWEFGDSNDVVRAVDEKLSYIGNNGDYWA